MMSGSAGEMYFECRVPIPLFITLSSKVTTDQLHGIEDKLRRSFASITEKVSVDSQVRALQVRVSYFGDVSRIKLDLQEYRPVIRIYEFPIPESTLIHYQPSLKAAAKRFYSDVISTSNERYAFYKYKPNGY